MALSSRLEVSTKQAAKRHDEPPRSNGTPDHQMSRWGGLAGLAGAALMLGAGVVVGTLGLPDADDVDTLRDFADIESGRLAEHFLYLGALMLFALHVLALHWLLRVAHPPAALFGTVTAAFGLVIMTASSLLHVSTSPLADLYTAPETSPEERQAIEYAWHGAQSVFDTMLATGVLLVPIGIVLLGLAMRNAPAFGARLGSVSIGLGTIGIIGAVIAIVQPGSIASAASVLAIALFAVSTGWRMLKLGKTESIDLT